jgi:DNA-damage-inducible protein D
LLGRDIIGAAMSDKPSGTEVTVFNGDPGAAAFEDMGIENGTRTWKEADLESALGYAKGGLQGAIRKAQQACISVAIPIEDNFLKADDGAYKLTRFACYLIAINADSKKPQVAAAQVYFAGLAETFQNAVEHAEGVERVAIREEMTSGMKSLDSTAKKHGVVNYAFFLNAGYRGMYNMNLSRLKDVKSLPKGEQLLDRMGKVELAANLFRVTQTDERIKHQNLHGQRLLENAAENVGRDVRKLMIKTSGRKPEELRLAAPIKDVKKAIKSTSAKFKQLDGKRTTKPVDQPSPSPDDDTPGPG